VVCPDTLWRADSNEEIRDARLVTVPAFVAVLGLTFGNKLVELLKVNEHKQTVRIDGENLVIVTRITTCVAMLARHGVSSLSQLVVLQS
jgi:hypothetical protein